MTLTTNCEKHGQAEKALPIIEGAIRPAGEWPKDVAEHPRVCVKCLAEAMVNPIRKCA